MLEPEQVKAPSGGKALMQLFAVKSENKLNSVKRFIRDLPIITQNVLTKEGRKFFDRSQSR
jgi:hypothetical protein